MPYYSEKLSGTRLKRVYDIATPRVRQYLDSEIKHVLDKIRPGDMVLDLGCGYGRVIPDLANRAGAVVGIDLSFENLKFGHSFIANVPNYHLARMDAASLGFKDSLFDVVICIQNGISAFHVDKTRLISEAVRVTKRGGLITFSTYSEKFWDYRMEWFQIQAGEGLLGEIDYDKTGSGIITCKDGFTATTVTADQFRSSASGLDVELSFEEVDNSSLFCEIIRR